MENYFWEFGFRCFTSKRWMAAHPRGSALWSFSVLFVILRIKTPKVARDKDKGSWCDFTKHTHIVKGNVIQCQRSCVHILFSAFHFINCIPFGRMDSDPPSLSFSNFLCALKELYNPSGWGGWGKPIHRPDHLNCHERCYPGKFFR